MKGDYQSAMALNPYSGELMNIKVFWDFMYNTCGAKQAEKVIDDAIRYIVTCGDEYVPLNPDCVFKLYLLRDMFKELRECEISIPEK